MSQCKLNQVPPVPVQVWGALPSRNGLPAQTDVVHSVPWRAQRDQGISSLSRAEVKSVKTIIAKNQVKKVNFKFQPARMSHWLDGRRPKVSRNSKYQQVIFILNINHAFINQRLLFEKKSWLERMNLPKQRITFYKRGESHREEEFSCYSYRQSSQEGPLEVTSWFSISVCVYFMYLCIPYNCHFFTLTQFLWE